MDLSRSLDLGATKLAGRLGLSQAEKEVVRYGLELIANHVLSAAILLAAAAVAGTVPTTVAAAAPAAVTRLYAGGLHAESRRNCIIITTLAYGTAGWLAAVLGSRLQARQAAAACMPLLGLVIYAVWRYAPQASPRRPIASPRRRARLRCRARLAAGFCVAAVASLLAPCALAAGGPGCTPINRSLALGGTLGLALQALTLLPSVANLLGPSGGKRPACPAG